MIQLPPLPEFQILHWKHAVVSHASCLDRHYGYSLIMFQLFIKHLSNKMIDSTNFICEKRYVCVMFSFEFSPLRERKIMFSLGPDCPSFIVPCYMYTFCAGLCLLIG